MKTVKTAWIFDVDGVITNPSEKKVTQPKILDEIIKRLEQGEPVALNTGRSLAWLIDQVINPLIEKVKNKTVLNNFFVSSEKGGVWLTIDEKGKIKQFKDGSITTPEFLQDQIRQLIETKYSQSMFYDESKLGTMISTEMIDGYSIEKYTKQQETITKDLENILKANKLNGKLIVDPSTIATDVQNKQVGKGFAIQRIIKWLEENEINPKRFITFGDSFSDVEMAQKLQEMNLKVEFVFVGEKGKLKGNTYPFPVIFTKELFEKGTLEFLKSV